MNRLLVMRKFLYNQVRMINKILLFMMRVKCQLLIPDHNCIELILNFIDHNYQKLGLLKLNSLIFRVIKIYRNKH